MPARLNINLNGPFDARIGDSTIGPLSRRSQALLAYLALQPRNTASRAAVMTLLWGDRSEGQARASLRQELSVLRRIIPDEFLMADRQNIWLLNADITVPSEHELLAGFDLPSPTFEEWLRDTRATTSNTPKSPQRTGRPAIAILAFEQIGTAETEAFADGLVEEITGTLSRIRDFHVIARQSSYALNGENLTVTEAANRLGADYLINGSIRVSGEKVRVSVQLINGQDGRTLWADKFDDHLDELFDLQDRITLQIAGQISPNLRAAEVQRARTQPPANLSAYSCLLKAYPHFWAHSRDHNLRAIAYLDQALERDPQYAQAMALKAWCHAQHPIYMWSNTPEADRAIALKCAAEAAQNVGQSAPTLTAIGAAYSIAGADAGLALSYINRALDIDPSNAWAWLRLGWHGTYTGDVASSEAAFAHSLALSPLDPFKFNMLSGRATLLVQWTDRYEEAVALFEEGLRLNPTATWQYRDLISAYYKLGDRQKLKWAGQQLLNAYPGLTVRKMEKTFARINEAIADNHMIRFTEAGIPSG
ncbi:MAG: hypothetical protein ACPGGK_03560 [Pikeienuella sp.]